MHELSITQDMLDLVLKQAKESGGGEVEKINLVIGEMTGVVEQCIRFYLDFLAKGTPAEGVALAVTNVPIKVRCRACDKTFEPDELDWSCPHCGGKELEIIAGKELFVESIEVE